MTGESGGVHGSEPRGQNQLPAHVFHIAFRPGLTPLSLHQVSHLRCHERARGRPTTGSNLRRSTHFELADRRICPASGSLADIGKRCEREHAVQ